MSSETRKQCRYFQQACSNEKFLENIDNNFPTDFYDWKTTITFYSALHYLKSYADTKNISLEDHRDTFNKLYSQSIGLSPTLMIDSEIRRFYKILYEFAHTTRYNGYVKKEVSGKIGKTRYKDAKEYLNKIRSYFIPLLERANVIVQFEEV